MVKFAQTGARANSGIGLAISSNQIARFLPLLEQADGGIVLHGRLRGLVLDQEENDGLRNGAEADEVRPDMAAEKAGLQAGDRIVAPLPVYQ